jgi:uncharacterized protein (DUF433 family)
MTSFPHVTYRRGTAGQPAPVIRDTGIRVQTIVTAAQHWGMSPAETASEYELTEQQVTECLAYYAARPTEIDAHMQAEDCLTAPDA